MISTLLNRVTDTLVPLVVVLAVLPGTGWAASVQEFVTPTAASGPYGITAGPDGALWFPENRANKIGRVTTDGSFTEFAIPPSGRFLTQITAGPDGALWFPEFAPTEGTTNKIGRITTAGVITEYELPIPYSRPLGGLRGIVAGPDGALWLEAAGKIGRITTSGAISEEHTLPDGAEGITAGPDRALWFIESEKKKIGRITTSGAISEYAVPWPLSRLSDIVAGPDGALWFTEVMDVESEEPPGRIGRATTDGRFRKLPWFEFPVDSPTALTPGPDGVLWFAEAGGNAIGRVTTDGRRYDRFVIPTPTSGPTGLAAGPDGGLWFTERNNSKIGRIDVGAAPTSSLRKVIKSLKLEPRRFRAARKGASVASRTGTTVTYKLFEKADVRFHIEKWTRAIHSSRVTHGPYFSRLKGSFTHKGRAGTNRFRFAGWLARKRLERSKYRLVAVPILADATSVWERAGFTIIR